MLRPIHFHDQPRLRREAVSDVAAFASWIARHPDDGRLILTNGYDWTYFTVEDTPYFVRNLRIEGDRAVLQLSDGEEEDMDPTTLAVGAPTRSTSA